MTKIIPGLDFVLCQSNVKSKFTISDGKFHTRDVLIEGELFGLTGRGDYYLNNDLDFKVRVNLLKSKTLMGMTFQRLLSPLRWFLEFRLTGTFDKPRWYLRTFSKDMLKKLGLSRTDGAGKK